MTQEKDELFPFVSPERVGLSSKRLGRLDDVMQGFIDRGELAGIALLIARRGAIAHSAQYGLMDMETSREMRPDTIFRIASMVKPITSVAAMILFEKGYFLLTDPISAYLPDFRDVRVFDEKSGGELKLIKPDQEITIWHLLTHTSCLGYSNSDNQAVATLYQEVDPGNSSSLADMAHKLARLPLFVQPGSQWHYGYSHDVLARLIEIVSGRDFGDFLTEEIFGPLGMNDTGHHVSEGKIERLATAYGPAEDAGLEVIDPAAEKYTSPPALKPGGHGLFATAPDYLRFAQMILNGGRTNETRILSRRSVESMTANQLPAALLPIQFSPEYFFHGIGYGLGFGVIINPAEVTIPGSAGSIYWVGALNTTFWIDPQEDLIGIFMAQLWPAILHPARKQFKELVYQALDN